MNIIWYHPSMSAEVWLEGMRERLPGVSVRHWQPGDNGPADYALVRKPPNEMLAGRHDLRGVFALGAGVDEIMAQLRDNPDLLPDSVPVFRLEDTGMAIQMQEYAVCQVLNWFRRFDDYRQLQQESRWLELPEYRRETFTVGILGAGVLGQSVAQSLKPWGFPLRSWSRSKKQIDGVTSFAGQESLSDFLQGTQVLINLLPSTPQTVNIINASLLAQLPHGAFFLNLARGAHVVEDDLLAALESGQIKGAALDVFQVEPLALDHPFWRHPRVTVTPHNAAVTLPGESMDYYAHAITLLEAGEMPAGQVDRQRGY
ncbi:glyoxylate/hydroxypyruvate reductase GhrA [Candidatus Pantoea multigeneris]|uniref:Glyoxylate/hydroxypyruvate reductase GhrA n=1 Tax=Candidatus Pantoea multigeneris TaxID=2608357 RepID=A0ABX0R8Z9_9GAMM|nr:glyoxylate/hydroxypyruvate reductase GhrA [Pantoea multigeneris]NIF21840.1 glyoxylate/hydroxypyruvate reductase GhrA [Pantoea multigeneris]